MALFKNKMGMIFFKSSTKRFEFPSSRITDFTGFACIFKILARQKTITKMVRNKVAK